MTSIAVVLPRGTSFGQLRASSIDLCVHHFVSDSNYAASTAIHCAGADRPFFGFNLRLDYGGSGGQFTKALRISDRTLADNADLVIVHQPLPTAFVVTKVVKRIFFLHAHNFQKLKTTFFRRAGKCGLYASFAVIIFVSEECRRHFHANWPNVNVTTFVVHNSLDLSLWSPAPKPINHGLFACRAAPGKGVLEAVQALRRALPIMRGWTSQFMLTEPKKQPDYFAQVSNIAKLSGGSISTLLNQTRDIVKKANETSEIALVLSKWQKRFGRTATEAHAGGAALISSGTGGLREVSGDASIFMDSNNDQAMAEALIHLSSEENLRHSLVAAGYDRMLAMFDIRKVAEDSDRVYARFLNDRARQQCRARSKRPGLSIGV